MRLWIARDKDGILLIRFHEPIIDGLEWISLDYRIIDKNLFPEVTFENSPVQVELKLVNNIANGFAEDLLTNCKPLEGELSKFVDDNFDNLI